MERPATCPVEVYLIMRECWNHDPAHRPTFSKLVGDLDKILRSGCQDYLEMSFPLPSDQIPPSLIGSSGETLVCGGVGGPRSSLPASSSPSSLPKPPFPRYPHCPSSAATTYSPIKYTQPSISYSFQSAPPLLPLHSYQNAPAMTTFMPAPPPYTANGLHSSEEEEEEDEGEEKEERETDFGVTYTPLMGSFESQHQQQQHTPPPPRSNPSYPYANHAAMVAAAPYLARRSGRFHEEEEGDDGLCRCREAEGLMPSFGQEEEEEEMAAAAGAGEEEGEDGCRLDDLTLDEYREQFAEHLQSSAL